MMHCAGCGNELQEGAIICRCCMRIVQFKTHFVVIHAYVLNALSQPIGEVYYQVEPEILLPGTVTDFSISIPCRMDLVHRVRIEIFDAREQPEIKRPVKWS